MEFAEVSVTSTISTHGSKPGFLAGKPLSYTFYLVNLLNIYFNKITYTKRIETELYRNCETH